MTADKFTALCNTVASELKLDRTRDYPRIYAEARKRVFANEGTSEGAEKGWATRRGGAASTKAEEASTKADDASGIADGKPANPAEAHAAARDAHLEAQKLHQEASSHHLQAGNGKLAQYHSERAGFHKGNAEHHDKLVQASSESFEGAAKKAHEAGIRAAGSKDPAVHHAAALAAEHAATVHEIHYGKDAVGDDKKSHGYATAWREGAKWHHDKADYFTKNPIA